MKNTKIIFLRHAHTKKDPSTHAALWSLSIDGVEQAEQVAKNKEMHNVDAIYVSTEPKTILTIKPLIKKLLIQPEILNSFDEVQRGEKYLSDADFAKEKVLQLTDLSYKAFNGETGIKALERFQLGIKKVASENEGKTILIVTHGTILNIYFASLLKTKDLINRWENTDFCAFGIIKNNIVIKDII